MDLATFIDDLSSSSPAPGGGAASAIYGAIATALTSMVCALTEGREKYSEYESLVQNSHKEILELQSEFKKIKDEDIAAFNKISDAYKMPKNSDDEIAKRNEAIQNALIPATKVPFKIMKLAARGYDINEQLYGKSNAMAVSDLHCAKYGYVAAISGAYENVLINLKSSKNQIENIAEEAKAIFEKYCA